MAARIEGAQRLAAGLQATQRDLRQLDDVSAEVAASIRTDAQRAAPRRSGALANSASVTPAAGGGARVGFGNSSVRYAGPLNFGVGPRSGLRGPHNIRATRFFTKAVEAAEKSMPEEYRQPIQKSLDRIKGA